MNNYSEEQKNDIIKRVDDAIKMLGDLNLGLSVQMTYTNIGNDNFATKPVPYLADTKYVLEGDVFVEKAKETLVNETVQETE